MKNININQTIRTLSNLSSYLVVVATALLLAQICWWAANPLGYNSLAGVAIHKSTSEAVAQDIQNHAPFGVVVVEKAPVPQLADQVKVVGIYAGGPKNSIAFLQINEKNSIAQIGDSVLDGKLKQVNANNIVISVNDQDVTIELSGARNTDSNSPPMSTNATSGQYNGYIPSQNNTPPASNQDDQNHGSGRKEEQSIGEKRRKMIEEFQSQNNGNNTNSANAPTGGSAPMPTGNSGNIMNK